MADRLFTASRKRTRSRKRRPQKCKDGQVYEASEPISRKRLKEEECVAQFKDQQHGIARTIRPGQVDEQFAHKPDKEMTDAEVKQKNLFFAVRNGLVENCLLLLQDALQDGVDKLESLRLLNFQDQQGWTALMLSALNSNTTSSNKMVQFLIHVGANVNVQNMYGYSALMLGTGNSRSSSNNETVRLLLEAGANPDLQENESGVSALMLSSSSETVKLLLKHKVNMNLQNKYGRTALMVLCAKTKLETVKLLIEAGVDLNLKDPDGNTALIQSVLEHNQGKREQTVKLLIKAGADLNLSGKNQCTALMISVFCSNFRAANNLETMKLLINAGAKLDVQEEIGGVTALMLSCMSSSNIEPMKLLIKSGANLDIQDKRGYTALMKAIEFLGTRHRNIEIVKLLIKAGANINLVSKGFPRSSALDSAIDKNHSDAVELLLQSGQSLVTENFSMSRSGKKIIETQHNIIQTLRKNFHEFELTRQVLKHSSSNALISKILTYSFGC